jgi:hypothetical protein
MCQRIAIPLAIVPHRLLLIMQSWGIQLNRDLVRNERNIEPSVRCPRDFLLHAEAIQSGTFQEPEPLPFKRRCLDGSVRPFVEHRAQRNHSAPSSTCHRLQNTADVGNLAATRREHFIDNNPKMQGPQTRSEVHDSPLKSGRWQSAALPSVAVFKIKRSEDANTGKCMRGLRMNGHRHHLSGDRRDIVNSRGAEVRHRGMRKNRHSCSNCVQSTRHLDESVPAGRHPLPLTSGEPSFYLTSRHSFPKCLFSTEDTALRASEAVDS